MHKLSVNSEQIDSLIKLGIGDIERLNDIKQSLERGITIHDSDTEYVEKLVTEHFAKLAGGNRQTSQPMTGTGARLQRPPEWKSESTTLLFSILLGLFGLQGVGHIYVGKVSRGIVILIGSLALWIIIVMAMIRSMYAYQSDSLLAFAITLLIVYFIIFIYQVRDARKLCREYNDYYEQHGTPPKW